MSTVTRLDSHAGATLRFSQDEALDAAYARCAEVVRTRARNFYYGLRLTPEPKRSAIYSVYAWMRQADDEADAAGAPALKVRRLALFREAAERLIRGEPLGLEEQDPVWIAFRATVRRYELDPADLRHLLDGLDHDLAHEIGAVGRPPDEPVMICDTREDLRRYCYCVASTVGLICIAIWGLRRPGDLARARELAVKRGLAFQLTNILRDFAQDYGERRVYLPGDDFRRHGLTPSELRRWARPADCEAFVRDIADWSRGQYVESAPLDAMIDPGCFAAMRTMTRIYSGLLTVIERDPARIVGPRRIRLQSVHKAGIALRAYLRAWVNQHSSAASA